MKLIVGLGNPGKEYENTRHNIGYMFLDYVTNNHEFSLNKRFNAMEYETNINGEKIGSPFEIKAIGSPEALANLSRPGGWLSKLEDRGIKVSTPKKSNSITIPKYSGVLNFKYISNSN